jgi:hypothetical protein
VEISAGVSRSGRAFSTRSDRVRSREYGALGSGPETSRSGARRRERDVGRRTWRCRRRRRHGVGRRSTRNGGVRASVPERQPVAGEPYREHDGSVGRPRAVDRRWIAAPSIGSRPEARGCRTGRPGSDRGVRRESDRSVWRILPGSRRHPPPSSTKRPSRRGASQSAPDAATLTTAVRYRRDDPVRRREPPGRPRSTAAVRMVAVISVSRR